LRSRRLWKLDRDDFQIVAAVLPSDVHAVMVCASALWLMNTNAGAALEYDKIRGTNELAMVTCGISCGYFLYDFFLVMRHTHIDVKFLVHAIVCGLAFWFSMEPAFQYFTVRFLLFELSTPLLHLTSLCRIFRAPKNVTDMCWNVFGVAFAGCRILYGIPLGIQFFCFVLDVVDRKKIEVGNEELQNLPSDNVLYFAGFAVLSMTGLNLFWFMSGLVSGVSKNEEKVL